MASIAQEVSRRRHAARQEADARLASRLGGTWTQLSETYADATAPRTRPAGTTSGDTLPASHPASQRDQLTSLEVPPAARDLAALAP